jgi:hypothetical protein
MNKRARKELEDGIIKNTMEYVKNTGRFFIQQSKKYRVAGDDEATSKTRTWFDLKTGQVLLGSFVVTCFLKCNRGLIK